MASETDGQLMFHQPKQGLNVVNYQLVFLSVSKCLLSQSSVPLAIPLLFLVSLLFIRNQPLILFIKFSKFLLFLMQYLHCYILCSLYMCTHNYMQCMYTYMSTAVYIICTPGIHGQFKITKYGKSFGVSVNLVENSNSRLLLNDVQMTCYVAQYIYPYLAIVYYADQSTTQPRCHV